MMLARNLPIDGTVEIVIRDKTEIRGLDANALMWVGPLRDIAEQAWVDRKQFLADIWHEFFKALYLPEGDEEDFDTLVKAGYRKWDYTPDGKRVLIGSTTQLTKRGMAQYITKIEAYAQTDLGVKLSARPEK